ncbi:PREDICTED: prefoldin subunit 2 [Nicrophorus vespilloides]|uniref:Prefoldin subunit 2 n=1 Tax=Nicrophorus vespilloides TaxID=110193 RepID=A0ABM1MU87_NICVS|nr:PREDICTED: prefoldin subunit 2 [Nicrophorus vespilloides]
MASEAAKKMDKKGKGPTPDDILNGFNTLRVEQRTLASKISEFEADINEHKMVIETLKNVDGERKCHRLIGGILVEKQVKDVLPALTSNRDKLVVLTEKLNEQLAKMGKDIIEYKEKHNIRIRGQEDMKSQDSDPAPKDTRGNVLVS